MGIMKRLEPFIDWFMPIVAASGAPESICPECGNPMQGDPSKNFSGGHAVCRTVHVHRHLLTMLKPKKKNLKILNQMQEKVFRSVIFGLVSAIPWAVVYALGRFVGWLAALIGAAIVKGYTMSAVK